MSRSQTRRTRADEPAGHDYFVSLADLLTGAVFLFVILLCAMAFRYQSAEQRAEAARREAVAAQAEARAAQGEAEAARVRAEAEARAAESARASAREKERRLEALSRLLRQREVALQEVLAGLAAELARDGVRVQFDPANGVLRLPDDLLFDPGSDALKARGLDALRAVARRLLPVLREGTREGARFRLESVFVEGHTDPRPIRTDRFADNWELSTARATGCYRALVRAEPALESVRNAGAFPILGVSGYGENRAVADNATEDGRARNRRIDIRFLLANPSEEEISRLRSLLDP